MGRAWPGGLPCYCIQAQHYQLGFEILYSNFILRIPSLLRRDVLWFWIHWLFLAWVTALWKIPDAKFPFLSLCLFSTSSSFNKFFKFTDNKFGQSPSLWDFIWTCLVFFHRCLLERAPSSPDCEFRTSPPWSLLDCRMFGVVIANASCIGWLATAFCKSSASFLLLLSCLLKKRNPRSTRSSSPCSAFSL